MKALLPPTEGRMRIIFDFSLGFGIGFASAMLNNANYCGWSCHTNPLYQCKSFFIII